MLRSASSVRQASFPGEQDEPHAFVEPGGGARPPGITRGRRDEVTQEHEQRQERREEDPKERVPAGAPALDDVPLRWARREGAVQHEVTASKGAQTAVEP